MTRTYEDISDLAGTERSSLEQELENKARFIETYYGAFIEGIKRYGSQVRLYYNTIEPIELPVIVSQDELDQEAERLELKEGEL